MEVRGVSGELRWGYHTAALVRQWTATRGQAGWSLEGTLLDARLGRLSQRPLVFEAPLANGRVWRWPILALQITGASAFSAVLGPKE